MATAAITAKLQALIGANDMDVSEIKLVVTNWEASPRKLHTNVVNSVKSLEKIPPALQILFINASDKAVRAIGELLCDTAQDLVLKDFPDDVATMVRKSPEFKVISDNLWSHLTKMAKGQELGRAVVRNLVARKDCPDKFGKAAGYTQDTFKKAQLKARATKTVHDDRAALLASAKAKPVVKPAVKPVKPAVKPAKAELVRPAKTLVSSRGAKSVKTAGNPKTVKTRHVAEVDDDFADPKRVAASVRTTRRPR